MIKSMTGFGRSSIENENSQFIIEIKSVNHRYFDFNVKMPRNLISLEDRIRKVISERVNRGKFDVFITQNVFQKQDIKPIFNEKLGDDYYNCLKQIKERYNLKDDINISLLTRFQDVITIEQKEEDLEVIWNSILIPLQKSLELLLDMREKEGTKLKEDIEQRCTFIKNMVDRIAEFAPKVVNDYREKLHKRIKELLSDSQIDENRIAMEVALFADKVNIDEEIVRLNSHLVQMKNTVSLDEPVGRKLDFLVQEMNREVNTIGSKANDLELSKLVLNIKNEIEKIREQVQNIE